MHNKGFDICFGDEKITIYKNDSEYGEWIEEINKFIIEKDIKLVNTILKTGYNLALIDMSQEKIIET
jgi:hypothetical protein